MPSTSAPQKCSSGTFISCCAAARWNTERTPSMASCTVARSVIEPSTISPPRALIDARFCSCTASFAKARTRTRSPLSRQRRASLEPMKPVPPVIRTVIGGLSPRLQAGAGRERQRSERSSRPGRPAAASSRPACVERRPSPIATRELSDANSRAIRRAQVASSASLGGRPVARCGAAKHDVPELDGHFFPNSMNHLSLHDRGRSERREQLRIRCGILQDAAVFGAELWASARTAGAGSAPPTCRWAVRTRPSKSSI